MAKADSIASGVAHFLMICRISDFWMSRSSGMFGHVWMKKNLAQSPNEPKMLYAVIGRARCFASDSPFKWP